MARSSIVLSAFALVLPLAIDVPAPHPDSNETRFSVSGGAGSYAIIERGCEGEILRADRVRFRDGAASVEHQFPGPVRVGVRAGVMRERPDTGLAVNNSYVNPNLSLEWKDFGIGAGYLRTRTGLPFDEDVTSFPSAHVRFGDPDAVYLSVEILEGAPIYSGGGFVAAGIGVRPVPRVHAWAGLSAGPYDAPGVAVRSQLLLTPHLLADVRVRLGQSANIGENAVSLGLTYRMPWRSGAVPAADAGSLHDTPGNTAAKSDSLAR